MKTLGGYARLLVRFGGFVVWTLLTWSAFEVRAFFAPPSRRPHVLDKYIRTWAKGCLALFHVKYVISGIPAPTEKGRLVLANHRSPLDVVILLRHFGGCMLSHAGVRRWPLLGLVTRRVGTIFVDRESRESGRAALLTIRQRLTDGYTVGMFPEGTTFEGDRVRAFRKGFITASYGLTVDVILVGLCYSDGDAFVQAGFAKHVKEVASRSTIRISIACGVPFSASTLQPTDAPRVQASVQELVDQARAAHVARWGVPPNSPGSSENLAPPS
ncbi:MAG: 1-acyl-sn-glycerol-3-phosphate acyltransferase [Myxococcales bacterium]|nr:1-acyl-sn-glycerol-3-phosphate acyltransferase [Myxococcales bacterium]MCB9707980.1 1-acyl-sn-glycerol-3-phosphate acyltransferase [Myxococcales bacterium]